MLKCEECDNTADFYRIDNVVYSRYTYLNGNGKVTNEEEIGDAIEIQAVGEEFYCNQCESNAIEIEEEPDGDPHDGDLEFKQYGYDHADSP